MAGVQGFEPQSTAPEAAVLPLNDTPSLFASCIITHQGKFVNPLSDLFWQIANQHQMPEDSVPRNVAVVRR